MCTEPNSRDDSLDTNRWPSEHRRIYSSGNGIYVNGRLLAEPYLPHDDPLGPPIASSQHPYRVPPGEFYLLGDNRADSCDSRYWGPVKGSSIVGEVVLVFWHDDHPDFRRF
jgi:signal peptidase I